MVNTGRALLLGLVVGALTFLGGGLARAQIPCVSDDQCAAVTAGHRCETVAAGLPSCGCSADGDCDPGLVCDTSQGLPGFCNDPPCAVDADCSASPYGHACLEAGCGCSGDRDCPQGRVCDTADGGFCIAAHCGADADCATDGYGQRCLTGKEGDTYCGCQQSADCLPGLTCDARGGPDSDRYCTARCSADDQCASDTSPGPSCDAASGLCGCAGDSDCSDPVQVCDPSLHLCVTPPCHEDADCWSRLEGFVCETSSGVCGCGSDLDCPTGSVCDPAGATCVDPSCASDDDCAASGDGARCDVTTGACGCDSDADCAEGLGCNTQLLFCQPAPGTGGDGAGDGGPAVRDGGPTTDAGAEDGPGGDGGRHTRNEGGCQLVGSAAGGPSAPALWVLLVGLGVSRRARPPGRPRPAASAWPGSSGGPPPRRSPRRPAPASPTPGPRPGWNPTRAPPASTARSARAGRASPRRRPVRPAPPASIYDSSSASWPRAALSRASRRSRSR